MRVLIVNTSDKVGGAALASYRLMEALNNNGVKAKMLVCDKKSAGITVVGISNKILRKWYFLWERWCIFCRLHFSKEHLWEIDTASVGFDITSLPEFQEADIIHLTWINHGMLSLTSIKKILKSGKPVVWTMHDLWNATGLCHYSRECDKFTSHCNNCVLLPNGGGDNDLSSVVFDKKKKLYSLGNIYFVTCSKWLRGEAEKSGLFIGQRITDIPNPIDTRIFHPTDKREARLSAGLPLDRKLILFVSQNVKVERKGIKYLVEAINTLVANDPDAKNTMGIAVLGGHSAEVIDMLSLPSYPLGYVSDEKKIVDIYNSVDVFVTPSLEDNLPNTIMEAMSCGVPCFGFSIGGIPEMIDHKENGYVAEFKNAVDISKGIRWVLEEADYSALKDNCVHKVAKSYSQNSVSMKYIDIYNQAKSTKKHFVR